MLVLRVLNAQDLNATSAANYQPVELSGPMPKEFTILSAKKAEAESSKNRQSQKAAKSTLKKQDAFLQSSYYSIDNMLLSGNVLFNDPMTIYVNRVADELLRSQPDVRAQTTFYVLRSAAVNAFATHQGVIFITTGLLARLHNEAELAYILAHESVHFIEKHAIREYMEADKIEKGKGTYKGMHVNEPMLRKCIFSREQEAEADADGLQILLKSKYSTLSLVNFYDVLKYADYPFDTLAFTPAVFENANLQFPEYFRLNKVKDIDTTDEYDDTYSTHPSLVLRKAAMLKTTRNIASNDKTTWAVSEADFLKVREMARFELCRTYLLNTDYEQALYAAYLLLNKYPGNVYLQKIMATALTDLAGYSYNKEYDKVHISARKVSGSLQAVCHFTEKLNGRNTDFCLISLAYVSKLLLKSPNDIALKEMYEYLIATLVKSGTAYDYLINAPKDTADKSYAKSAMLAFTTDEQLKFDFARYGKAKTKEYIDIDIAKPKRKKDNTYDTRTFHLGLDKLTVVDPYYTRVNANKREKFKYVESEGGQLDLVNRLGFLAKKVKLNLNILSTKTLKQNDTETLNDISQLDSYLNNRLAQPSNFQVPYLERDKMLALAQKYGTDNFMWTGVVSLTDKNLLQYGWLVLAIMYPVSAPFVLPQMITGGNRTLYFSLVYNVKTDEIKLSAMREIENRTTPTILNSHIYDVLSQIKKPAK